MKWTRERPTVAGAYVVAALFNGVLYDHKVLFIEILRSGRVLEHKGHGEWAEVRRNVAFLGPLPEYQGGDDA